MCFASRDVTLTSWNALWQQACAVPSISFFDDELRSIQWWKTVHRVSPKQLGRYEVGCLTSQKLSHIVVK